MKKNILTAILFATAVAGNAQGIYQFEDPGFENWTGTNTPGHEWHSFESATGNKSSFKSKSPKPQKVDGHNSTSAVELFSKYIGMLGIGANANGNLTTGVINMGSSTADDPNNYNVTKRGSEGQFLEFAGTPDAISFYAKFTSGGSQNGRGRFILHDDVDYRDPELTDKDGKKIQTGLVGEAVVPIPESTDWTYYEGSFVYTTTKPSKQYLLASFTTNPVPGGSKDDYLYIDDIKFIYYNTLKSLSYDGANISFSESTSSYDLSSITYDASKLHFIAKGKGATTAISYNKETGTVTITVNGNDISVNPSNKTEYTLQFAPEKKAEVTTYTNDLSVTLVSTSSTTAPDKNSINLIKEPDDSYSLELKNFVLKDSNDEMPIGNIKVTNLNKEGNTYTTTQTIEITEGDDPKYNEDDWWGTMLGEVPVVVSATVNGDQMTAQITIKDFPEVGDINVTFAPTIHLTESQSISTTEGLNNVVMTRSFKQGWNTVCLPFATSIDVLGASKAQEFVSANDYSLTFNEVADGKLEANKPYLIYFAADKAYTTDEPLYYGGNVATSTPIAVENNGITFSGNYQVNKSMNGLYGIATIDGKQKLALGGENATLPAGCAYFSTTKFNANGLRICFDGGEVTSINGVNAAEVNSNATVYNLQGVKVSNQGTTNLPAGLYIVNGKKVIVK